MINKAKEYSQLGVQSITENASPHTLIQMLINGAIDKTTAAKGYMQRQNDSEKGHYISWSISIIGGLQNSLDLTKGGEIAANLHNLYDYMIRQLTHANIHNEENKLDEVINLMKQIKLGWDGIVPKQENPAANTSMPRHSQTATA